MKKNKPHTLCPETLADLARSGLTKKDALALGIRSLTEQQTLFKFSIQIPSYVFPYDGGFERAKLLEAIPRGKGKLQKYTQKAGYPPQLFLARNGRTNWPALMHDTNRSLYITEGEKKGAALNKLGYACIALSGVDCWLSKGKPLPEWERFTFANRNVFIVFDSDLLSNPAVQRAERRLAAYLRQRGAIVHRIRLPEVKGGKGKTGVDDFLVSKGFPKDCSAARRAFNMLPLEEIPSTDVSFPMNDDGNARRFIELYGEELRYVPTLKQWMAFDADTGLWRIDTHGRTMELAKTVASYIKVEAEREPNELLRKALLRWAKDSGNEIRLTAMLSLAKTQEGMPINESELNFSFDMAATGDGMAIDLIKSCQLAADPEEYFTQKLGTHYNAEAACPRWEKFLDEIMDNDREMVRYLQRAVGYSLSGEIDEQCLFLLWGHGCNGKSVFMDTLLAMLGDYGIQAQPETFMEQRFSNSARNDIARLKHARMVATSEGDEGQWLAESFIKQWTGGEDIVARQLYKEYDQFRPQGKLWMATNHKPRIRGTDHAIWRRIHLISFNMTIAPNRIDRNLSKKLRSELPGILNWAMSGYREYLKVGLNPPASVKQAVADYHMQMDVIGQWVKENCCVAEKSKELVSDLYRDYDTWTQETGSIKFVRGEFSRRLEERGFLKKDTTDRATGRKGIFLFRLGLRKSPRAPKF